MQVLGHTERGRPGRPLRLLALALVGTAVVMHATTRVEERPRVPEHVTRARTCEERPGLRGLASCKPRPVEPRLPVRQALLPVKRPTVTSLRADLRAVRTHGAARSFHDLRALTERSHDPRVRIAAMTTLASTFGPDAREVLSGLVRDEREPDRIRANAARALGHTGPGSRVLMEDLIRSSLRARVRAGAVRGLVATGGPEAAWMLISLAHAATPVVRATAQEAIEDLDDRAANVLDETLVDDQERIEIRVGALRALVRTKTREALGIARDALRDPRSPPALRVEAADGLGRMGYREALPWVTAAQDDPDPNVVRTARIAMTRLQHLR